MPLKPISPSLALAVSAATAAPLGSAAPGTLAPDDTVAYTVLLSGNEAGVEQRWVGPDHNLHYHFEFHDRGRGPALDEQVSLDAAGIPVLIQSTGHDYLKNPVEERFTLAHGTASWKNSAEAGSAPAASGAFYVTMDGVPEEQALLVRALLLAPGHRLPLLPAGEASLDSLGALTVSAGAASRTVVQYAVSGLGLTPSPIWLDQDGEFFAVGNSWLMVIRRGWEPNLGALLKAQTTTDSLRTSRLAASLARRPDRAVVFRNGDLFDAHTGRVSPRTTVVVQGRRISGVGPEGTVPVPRGAEVIDATGKTLMPGMWDMHVHLDDDAGLLNLAAGITTVRDLGNDIEESVKRQARFADGSLLGPRLVLAGIIDGPGPYAGPTKVLVATEDSARAAVRRYAALGYVQIKVYSSVRPELVPAIIEEAHARGLRVSGHVPAFMTAEQVVTLGYDEIQHANFLFLNFWADSVPDTRTPARFTAVAEQAASLDLSSPPVRRFIALLREHHTVVDPTVNIFESMFTARKGTIRPGYVAVAERVPPTVRRGFLTGGLPVPEGKEQRYHDSFAAMLRLVKLLYDARVRLEAGTDDFPGFAYQRELELYARAGIPPAQVLRIATLGAARVMKMDRELGSIASGKLADLLVVDGHPARRISDIRRVTLGRKDGMLYDPAALYRAVGVQPCCTAERDPASLRGPDSTVSARKSR